MKTTRNFFVSAMTLILIALVAGNVSAQGILKNGGVIRNTGTATYKQVQNYTAASNGTIVNSGTLNTTTVGGGTGDFNNTNGTTHTGTVKNYIGGIGNGTIVVANNIVNTIAGSTISNDTAAGLSTIKVAGAITNTAGTFTTTNGRVIYNGAAQNILATTYGTLVTDVGGTKTLLAATTVNDSLRIDNTSTLAVSTFQLNLAGATNVAQNSGVFTANAGIVAYNGDRNQSMIAAQYKTLTLSGATAARTKTSPGTLSFVATGSLTVDALDTLFVSSGNLDMSVVGTTLANSGAIKVAGDAAFNTSITQAGTFYYYGAIAQAVGAVQYANLILGNAGGKTFPNGGTVSVTGSYTINGGAGARTYTNSTFQLAGTSGNQPLTNLAESFNILQFTGAATKSLSGTAFSANRMDLLATTGVVTNNVTTMTLANVATVSLTIASGTELDNSLTMTMNMNGDLQNDGILVNNGTIGVY